MCYCYSWRCCFSSVEITALLSKGSMLCIEYKWGVVISFSKTNRWTKWLVENSPAITTVMPKLLRKRLQLWSILRQNIHLTDNIINAWYPAKKRNRILSEYRELIFTYYYPMNFVPTPLDDLARYNYFVCWFFFSAVFSFIVVSLQNWDISIEYSKADNNRWICYKETRSYILYL